MSYLVFKALHIIFVVCWFAGLFYIVRLFVYLTEAHERPPAERDVLLPQLKLMAWRLWFGITWPSAIATAVFGAGMLHLFWPVPRWLAIKLGLVAGLFAYHLACHWVHARLQADDPPWSSRTLRLWNELATLFLVSIVFLVVLKDALAMLWGIVGLVAFTAVLMAGITVYRRVRKDT